MEHHLLSAIAVSLAVASASAGEPSGDEIDRTVWTVISETVAANDLQGMAAVYHPDAVVVSRGGTAAIADQLILWGEGMERTRDAGTRASVSFRFETRQDGETTAFEAGMFRYAEIDRDGTERVSYVPFEALLVRKDGRWKILMERQKEVADESSWDALQRQR